jgi:hypothetical protein
VIRRARVTRHLATALLASAAAIPLLAGCEAGNAAPTVNFHPSVDGAQRVEGSISIGNVFVLGAPLGSNLQPGQSASLFLSLVNNGAPDRLLSITAQGTASSVTLIGGTIPVVMGHPQYLTGPQPQAYLVNLTRAVRNGSNLVLTLNFQREGAVTLKVPVIPFASSYTTLSPPPSPTPVTTAHPKLTSPSPATS